MSNVGKRERLTQNRVVQLFRDTLKYTYLGNREEDDNSNVDEVRLAAWLAKQGHSEKIIKKVLYELDKDKAISGSRNLYDANRDVYIHLRYGMKISPEPGERVQTIWLVDWKNPRNNDFAIAEEVTVAGKHDKRPDIVLYLNGIAIAVLELKRSTVSMAEGIRQSLDSQKPEFIRSFFSTIQLIMAGNETEGLRYGVIETREKYFLQWKEPTGPKGKNALEDGLMQLCRPDRLLEIIHDFMVFDAGEKKTCRHNQYFGIRAAQQSVRKREGGIIWHTQGSGKSLTMVWLAKWIRENVKDARVLLITDRTELDQQIETVFKGVNEQIYRTDSGKDLINVLNENKEWLICSLVHKFGKAEEGDFDGFIKNLNANRPDNFVAKGNVFVFVDECHRTQSGTLHEAMKAILPGAMLIGFTGTPLLKKDKQKSIEVFGPYIHTYKYDEAVRDGVVLDLRYEARDIDQHITSQEKVDHWFDVKTKGLTDVAKAQLKQRWGTMQKVLSTRSRLEVIVADILLDMATRDRLHSGHGNAILVTSSITSACRIFELFEATDLRGHCAIITSYKPDVSSIKGQDAGEGKNEALLRYDAYRRMLAAHFDESEDAAAGKIEDFEKQVKKRFIEDPGQMKLLIVVDKLLTGFDAPPATYLYIDKQMQDHGLFQAICRVNRLHGEDKEYGYIIDYKDLFKSLERSIKNYTGEAFDDFDADDVAGLLKDRLEAGRERLDELRESLHGLCEDVRPPQGTQQYLSYFVTADSLDGDQIEENEAKRVTLYKLVSSFVRAYADLASEMDKAGYTAAEAEKVRLDVDHFEKVRQEVRLASGDYIDMKMYEPAMRQLLDTYVSANPSVKISAFDDMTLVQLIVERGEDALDALPASIRKNEEAMAETIENNVRKVIIDESSVNPKYYETMYQLLDALIKERRAKALNYKAYLAKIIELTKRVANPGASRGAYPASLNTGAKRALYDNLDRNEELATKLDAAIQAAKRADWRDNRMKCRELRNEIKKVLGGDDALTDRVFEIVKNQRDY